jgi:site-specific recombinase XerD
MIKLFTDPHLPQDMCQGTLSGVVPAYATLLFQQGYTQHYASEQIHFLSDLNQWLDRQQFQITNLSEATFRRYLRSRHKRFRPWRAETSILKRLLQLLDAQGLLPNEAAPPLNNPRQRVEQDFDHYLSEERGLSMATRINYRVFVERFLSAHFGRRPVRFTALHAKDVLRFVRNQALHLSPKRAGLMVTALRSFFRYLRHRGSIRTDLAACVPTIANWRLSSLPKFLQPHQVQQVLTQCDRRTAQGRRDYAILLLLSRLGLRACEIVSLALEDIDWQAGEITIRGKGNRMARLPLPPDVGQAIATYLKKDRPTCSSRRVFIRLKAPRRGFANVSADLDIPLCHRSNIPSF